MPGISLQSSLFSDSRARGIFPARTQNNHNWPGPGAERAGAQADIIGHLEAALLVTVQAGPLPLLSPVLSVRAETEQ